MLKVLIADDERKVCQLIQKLIHWDELGLELAGVANNGLEAYQFIIEHCPDITITDIRMPGMDGLEVVRRVTEAGLKQRFVIISGYRHFEYAHNALRYNVEDYLLKPINEQELNETLSKVIGQIQKETQEEENRKQTTHQLAQSRDSLRRHFITGVFSRQAQGTVDQLNEEYGLSLEENGRIQGYFVKIDTPGMVPSDTVLKKISDICEKRFSKICGEAISSITHSGVLLLVDFQEEQQSQMKRGIRALFEEIRLFVEIFAGFTVTIGVGMPASNIREARQTAQSAIDCTKCRIRLGRNRIIEAAALHYQVEHLEDLIDAEKGRQLRNLFETLDLEGYQAFLKEQLALFDEQVHPALYFDFCDWVLGIFMEVVEQNQLVLEDPQQLRAQIGMQLDHAKNVSAIFEAIYQPIYTVLHQNIEHKLLQSKKPIRMAERYIAEHYAEAIRLEDVAAHVYLSASYFCNLFKKEKGVSFIDYLTEYRLERAKEMLRSTDYSISYIGEQVGYPDSRYFSKLFTKTVGIKPSAYRNLYG